MALLKSSRRREESKDNLVSGEMIRKELSLFVVVELISNRHYITNSQQQP